jgi:group I intron endonuclease
MPNPLYVAGVYAIVNTVNHWLYIGSSDHIATRWVVHVRDLQKGVHHNVDLQRDWNEYGADAFSIEVLATTEIHPRTRKEDVRNLRIFERQFIDRHLDHLYNIMAPTVDGVKTEAIRPRYQKPWALKRAISERLARERLDEWD